MKILKQIGLLFLICWLGELISALLPFTFPSSIVAMLILFVCLNLGIIQLNQIEDVASFLLATMAFYFIPAGVSILNSYQAIQPHLLAIFLVVTICTVLTILMTAGSIHLILRFQDKGRKTQ